MHEPIVIGRERKAAAAGANNEMVVFVTANVGPETKGLSDTRNEEEKKERETRVRIANRVSVSRE